MSSKNKLFTDGLAAAASAGLRDDRKTTPRMGGVLGDRRNRLAEMAGGLAQTKTHLSVDPARCRMWGEHNRDYAALTYESCHDLIESLKAQGHQEMPAIVRRLKDDPDYEFEVICGARRHWAISWLRANTYPEFRFIVEPRELTDEQAFRIADLENRARQDLSDYERARDYLKGLGLYYGNEQKTMAERLRVSESWLSRYLDLARLPAAVIGAFASPHDMRIKHVMKLKPLLKNIDTRRRVLDAAAKIADMRNRDHTYLTEAPAVVRELQKAAEKPEPAPRRTTEASTIERPSDGRTVVTINRRSGKSLAVTFHLTDLKSRAQGHEALNLLLDQYWPEGQED